MQHINNGEKLLSKNTWNWCWLYYIKFVLNKLFYFWNEKLKQLHNLLARELRDENEFFVVGWMWLNQVILLLYLYILHSLIRIYLFIWALNFWLNYFVLYSCHCVICHTFGELYWNDANWKVLQQENMRYLLQLITSIYENMQQYTQQNMRVQNMTLTEWMVAATIIHCSALFPSSVLTILNELPKFCCCSMSTLGV